ncbi:hypothetical protein BGZ76_005301 [Entomortierella beljakovae]|nr:hypothetical protein BGZ76_005301 [Entomortierella beljakovae]
MSPITNSNRTRATRSQTGQPVSAPATNQGADVDTLMEQPVMNDVEEETGEESDEDVLMEGNDADDDTSESTSARSNDTPLDPFSFKDTAKELAKVSQRTQAESASSKLAHWEIHYKLLLIKEKELSELYTAVPELDENGDAIDDPEKLKQDLEKVRRDMKSTRDRIRELKKSLLPPIKEKSYDEESNAMHESISPYSIAPDNNNPKHVALVTFFKLKKIPVKDDGSMEIDYDQVKMPSSSDAPTLELTIRNHTDNKRVAVQVATAMSRFLDAFKRHYWGILTGSLFDDLAWKYMGPSLRKVSMDARFEREIRLPEYKNRNWFQVKKCLSTLFKLHSIRSELRAQLYAIKPLPTEDVALYADRIQSLFEILVTHENELPGLVENIVESFSIAGHQMAVKHQRDVEPVTRTNLGCVQLVPANIYV